MAKAIFFSNMDDVIEVFSKEGHHWFEPSTMEAWGSELHGLYFGRFFLTKEYISHRSRRKKWSVREIHLTEHGHSIRTIANHISLKRDALRELKKAAEE